MDGTQQALIKNDCQITNVDFANLIKPILYKENIIVTEHVKKPRFRFLIMG